MYGPTLATGQGPWALALDATSIYWTEPLRLHREQGVAERRDAGVILASGTCVLQSQSVAVDAANVYWSNPGTFGNDYTDGAVMRVPLAGGTPVAVATAQHGPFGVAVHGAYRFYWANQGTPPGPTPTARS